MSLPNCFPELNTQFFTNLNLQLNASATGEELQEAIDAAFAQISVLESTLTSQLNTLAPIEGLVYVIGANVGELAQWVQNFMALFLTPMLKPTITIPAQLTEIAAQVAALTALANEIKNAKFPTFDLTIPAVGVTCSL